MWTADMRCPGCIRKGDCKDRLEIIRSVSPLTNRLNLGEEFTNGPGDGVIIVACRDFSATPPDGQAAP